MKAQITIEDIRGALEKLEAAAPERSKGFTTRDVMMALACSEDKARARIRSAIEAGLIKHVGHDPRPSMDGRFRYSPVYALARHKR